MKRWPLAQLFPEGALVEVATAADESEVLLDPEELALMGSMAPSRRREFAAGRNTARRALRRLGFPAVALLRPASERYVAWPDGSVGSISHTTGLCAVACTRTSRARSIGIDVEQAGPLGSDIEPIICLPEELAAVAKLARPGASDWPRLLFAMKEAAYKTWYPVMRRVLEFHEMKVTVDTSAGEFAAAVSGTRLPGRFGWDAAHVWAGAWYPP